MDRDNLISVPGFRIKQSLRLKYCIKKECSVNSCLLSTQNSAWHIASTLCLLSKLNKLKFFFLVLWYYLHVYSLLQRHPHPKSQLLTLPFIFLLVGFSKLLVINSPPWFLKFTYLLLQGGSSEPSVYS